MRTNRNIYPRYSQNICVQKWNNVLFYSIITLISIKKTLGGLAGCSEGLRGSFKVSEYLSKVNQFAEAANVWSFPGIKTICSRRELGLKRTSERPTVRQWAEGKCRQSTP
jgi:hypothetical protein